MPDDSLLVCLPWNTKNYFNANGFNPLYRFLIESSIEDAQAQSKSISLKTLDQNAYKDYLTKTETKDTLFDHLEKVRSELLKNSSREFKHFWKKFNIKETIADELSEYDVKIIHTYLLTCQIKPYVYCIESFDTVLFPWKIDHTNEKENYQVTSPVKQHLQFILEDATCLAIISSNADTLNHFKRFFRSSIIDEKLYHLPIGITQKSFHVKRGTSSLNKRRVIIPCRLSEHQEQYTAKEITNIFTIIQQWQLLFQEDQFVFLSKLPDYEQFNGLISETHYKEVTFNPDIIFLGDRHLSEKELINLLQTSQYLLYPSRRPDIHFILSSMATGVIPIVINSPFLSSYGISQHNAILVGHTDKEYDTGNTGNVAAAKSSEFRQHGIAPAELIDTIKEIRQQPEIEKNLSRGAQELINSRYNSSSSKNAYFKLITETYQAFKETTHNRQRLSDQINQISFKGQNRFGTLSYFLPPLRKIYFNDFEYSHHYREILSLGTSTIYTNGASYIELDRNNRSLAFDLEQLTLDNDGALYEMTQSNFTYDSALDSAFYRIKHTNKSSHLEEKIKRLKRYAKNHFILRHSLGPIYRTYKKIYFSFVG